MTNKVTIHIAAGLGRKTDSPLYVLSVDGHAIKTFNNKKEAEAALDAIRESKTGDIS